MPTLGFPLGSQLGGTQAAPAIADIITWIVAETADTAPSLETTRAFKQATQNLELEKIPPASCMRQFEVRFVSLRDASAEGRGVQTPGVSDREARFTVRVAYARAGVKAAFETLIASDAELLFRTFGKSALYTGTTIRRCTVTGSSVDRNASDGTKVILSLDLEIRYRDTEN